MYKQKIVDMIMTRVVWVDKSVFTREKKTVSGEQLARWLLRIEPLPEVDSGMHRCVVHGKSTMLTCIVWRPTSLASLNLPFRHYRF